MICGGPLVERFAAVRDPESRARYALLACAPCEFGQTAIAPGAEAEAYGGAYYGGRHGFTERFCMQRRARILRGATAHPAARASAAPSGPRRLLDIGAGDGAFLAAARDDGWVGTGVEIGEAPRAAAAARGVTLHADLEAAAADGPFDAVTAWHSLEHIREAPALLRRVRGLMAPGAALVVAVPNAFGAQARLFGPRWLHLDVPRHVYHFGDRALTRLLESCGFTVVAREHQEFEYDVMSFIQSALNYVFPEPNVLFEGLTGRRSKLTPTGVASLALGAALGPSAVAATVLGRAAGRGGTLIAIARVAG